MERILDKFPDGDLMFVGHGASLSGIINFLLGRPAYVGLCTLSKFEKSLSDNNNSRWTPILIGDASHLSDKTNLRPY